MKNILITLSEDKTRLTGIVLIFLSSGLFIIPDLEHFNSSRNNDFGIFFFNYAISIIFAIIFFISEFKNHGWSLYKYKVEYSILLSILLFISAFSLNRDIRLFDQSANWVSFYIVIQSAALILLTFQKKLSTIIVTILAIIHGAGLPFFLYFLIYLTPTYPIGFIGFFLFGISLHVFVPLSLFIYSIILSYKIKKEYPHYHKPFIIGILIPLTAVTILLIQWKKTTDDINYIINENIISESKLPLWVSLSQKLPKNSQIEKHLKTDLVYTTSKGIDNWGWGFPRSSFNEVKKHDPIVVIGTLLFKKPDISEQDKIKILKAMYDSRHKAQKRLWSGDNLRTANIISNVKIFPKYRMAYTEKILSIENNQQTRRWRNQQEAIYTFHLPEGGVVTSLSLWIEGREEKGILTTKNKAYSAYSTIVGVESRDPSVIHWQEGNTVSVRVFPCTPQENRKFKIGVTAPLRISGDQLIYENIFFDGPSGSSASESIRLTFDQPTKNITFPFKTDNNGNNSFKCNKIYDPYWEVTFNASVLSEETFSFDDHSYQVQELEKTYAPYNAESIYLDINSSWANADFHTIWKKVKNKNVFAFNYELIQLNDQNAEIVFNQLSKNNFSLFPFNEIDDSSQALIISKSNSLSPNLGDLTNSKFSNDLTSFLKKKRQIKLFNIDHTLSPYLKILKELRVFEYDEGAIEELATLLDEKEFIISKENDSTIVIDNAQITIHETQGEKTGNAPDHLLRLYSYNNIMRTVSANYFKGDYINDETIAEARKAYVVSPLSSLIVLETQKDYDRFGINDKGKSLKNAAINSSGAVPEPHEWVLLIFTALLIAYYLLKDKFSYYAK